MMSPLRLLYQERWVAKARTGDRFSGFDGIRDVPPEVDVHIDERRIYIVDFSNGGGFVRSRVVPDMAAVFAAAAATAGRVGLPHPHLVTVSASSRCSPRLVRVAMRS